MNAITQPQERAVAADENAGPEQQSPETLRPMLDELENVQDSEPGHMDAGAGDGGGGGSGGGDADAALFSEIPIEDHI